MVSSDTPAAVLHRSPAGRPEKTAFLAGAQNIFRKEVLEWFRTRRFLVASLLTTLLLGVVPVGVFLHEGGLSHGRFVLAHGTYDNMMEAWIALSVTLGNYLMIALTMGMLVREEETGTAQWLFTKPVSRAGYGLAKYTANALVAILAAVVVPGLVFIGLTNLLFSNGIEHWGGAFGALGIASFHAAVVIGIILALSTLFRSQAPVAGIVIGLGFLPLVAAGAQSVRLIAWTIFGAPVWMGPAVAAPLARGTAVRSFEALVVWLLLTPLLVAFACWRLTRKQLQ
ncbi:MAG TPA: ABC transporter permease [Dehalococcoidia bacterium]|nr:ABC transporter permease [Dehalococcoidia bacterium]